MSGMGVRPQSHVDTPEWQSFEARMLARRAERRAQAARIRRARVAKGAGVLALLLVAAAVGFAGTWLIKQPIAFAAAPPVPPPQIALRTNDGVLPLPAVDTDSVPIVETAAPSDVDILADKRPAEGRATVPAPPAPRAEDAIRSITTITGRPAPAERSTTGEVFRDGVNERAVATTRPLAAPVPVEPAASPVTIVPGTREKAVPDEPTAVGTAGTQAVSPGLPVRADAPAASPTNAVNASRPLPDARAAIRNVLDRYRLAYQRLDAEAAGAVWPDVDRRALARAFGSLQSQQIDFHDCRIVTAAATAHATCTGRARAVPKIGNGGVSEADRTWEFSLVQKGSDWQIAKATVK